jgi:hypothetical protein
MRTGTVVTFFVGLVIACSMGCSGSSDPPPSTCADISGNYKVDATFASGTCDPKLFSTERAR